jgi:hypothetical protein
MWFYGLPKIDFKIFFTGFDDEKLAAVLPANREDSIFALRPTYGGLQVKKLNYATISIFRSILFLNENRIQKLTIKKCYPVLLMNSFG